MHIPSAETNKIEILSFHDALSQSGKRGDYDSGRWLYVPDFYTEYRYILGTRGSHPLICIGVNPSTAAPDALDPTLQSVQRIALSNGYDSFIMFNVYAQRATRPNDMDAECNRELHAENMAAFRYVLEASLPSSPSVWAAWGNIIEMRPYLPLCVADMIAVGEEYGAKWFTAGKRSVKGHPHHPLYLRHDSPLDSFDVKSYIKLISNKV